MGELTRTSGVEPAIGADADRHRPETEERGGQHSRQPAKRTPHDIQDVAQMMGIPAAEMTPRVREALDIIVNEYDRVRSELEREHERLAHFQDMAERDPLLPVANRRTFLRELARLINRAGQTQTVSSVAILHVDGLDGVRLGHGRAAADRLLADITHELAGGVRASDLVATLGGGDFAVILTLTEAAAAAEKTRDLAEAVRRVAVPPEAGGLPLDVAWGVRAFTAEDDAEQVLAAADDDLLRRRAAG